MRVLLLILTLLLLSSCSTLTPTAQAIKRGGQGVDRAFRNSYETLYEQPVEIETRFNPCSCDPALEFEANFYGQWRHVIIRGSDTAMAVFREKVRNLELHQVFEYSYRLSDELYTSTTGQNYYTLMIADAE